MMAFELVCKYLQIAPSKNLFLPFSLYSEGRREADDRFGSPFARTRNPDYDKDHYDYESNDFGRSYARLKEREKQDYDNLWAYGNSFVPAAVVDKDGDPMLDSKGKRITEPRFINTHALVLSSDPMDFLGRCSSLLCILK